MPYDPPAPPDVLTLQLEGTPAEPETVLELARPEGGVVRVREYPSPGTPREYDALVESVLARVEDAARDGRHVGADLYAVRRWLAARG